MENKKYNDVIPSGKSKKDVIYKPSVTHGEIGTASLAEFRGPILNQLDWNACTGFGTAGMLNSFFNRLTGFKVRFNPFWIWYCGRKTEGTAKENTGVMPRDIFKNLVEIGALENEVWHPATFDEVPPNFSDEELIKFKGYRRFDMEKSREEVISDYYHHIAEERLPIGICLAVYQSFEQYTPWDGVIKLPREDEDLIGYHWVYTDEVSPDGIILVNSWGATWGNNGTCLMPWDYVVKYVTDAWSLDPALP